MPLRDRVRSWLVPSPPPGAVETPHLAVLAGLLNLSGLGLGYLLLRRWVDAAVCCLVTAVLVILAVPAVPDGPPLPVVLAAVLVLAAAVVHGWLCGRYAPKVTLRPSRAGAMLGLLAVLLPVGGVSWYVETSQRELLDQLARADALVRQAGKGDFQSGKGTYHRALSTYGYIADDHPFSRAADRLPDRLSTYYRTVAAPYADKDYCSAVDPLWDLRTVPNTVDRETLGALATWPDDRLATSLYECGTGLLGDDPGVAKKNGDLYDLLTTFPRSEQAKKVEPALRAAVAKNVEAIGGKDPCPAVDGLDTLGEQAKALPGDRVGAKDALAEDAEEAESHVPSATYECGKDEFEDGKFESSAQTMEDFADTYPSDDRASYAKKVAVAAEVARFIPDAGRKLPPNRSTGSVKVFLVNDTAQRQEVLYTGGATGSTTVRACKDCFPYASRAQANQFACLDRSLPAEVIRVPRGTLYMVSRTAGTDSNVAKSKFDVRSNGDYLCLYQTFG